MSLIIKRVVVAGLLTGVLAVCGCNTWHGAGQDVERAGEKMQDR